MALELVRVVSEDQCPGTCCKASAGPPFPDALTGVCIHYDPHRSLGRQCMIYDRATREDILSPADSKLMEDVCIRLPYVQVGTACSGGPPITDFVLRDGTKWCDCWEWQSDG